MAHDHHRRTPEAAEAADDGLVVRELAIAAQLYELVDQPAHIVEEMRPVRVAGDLGLLPGVELGEGLDPQGVDLGAQAGDVVVQHPALFVGELVELLDLRLKLGDRLLEIQVMAGR